MAPSVIVIPDDFREACLSPPSTGVGNKRIVGGHRVISPQPNLPAVGPPWHVGHVPISDTSASALTVLSFRTISDDIISMLLSP